MAHTDERRRHSREGVVAPVAVSVGDDGHAISGKVLNRSRDGLYIETDAALPPERTVSIRIVAAGVDTSGFQKSELVGRIRWSRTLDDPFSALYGYGIQLEA
jgi:hypothetical protein